VLKSKVLRELLGSEKDGVSEQFRILHNEGHRDLYSSPVVVRVVKSRRLRWAGHVARMGRT